MRAQKHAHEQIRTESDTFEHIELPARLLDYVLRSNKSNINQSRKHLFSVFLVCSLTLCCWDFLIFCTIPADWLCCHMMQYCHLYFWYTHAHTPTHTRIIKLCMYHHSAAQAQLFYNQNFPQIQRHRSNGAMALCVFKHACVPACILL